jgi:hypothetical protein
MTIFTIQDMTKIKRIKVLATTLVLGLAVIGLTCCVSSCHTVRKPVADTLSYHRFYRMSASTHAKAEVTADFAVGKSAIGDSISRYIINGLNKGFLPLMKEGQTLRDMPTYQGDASDHVRVTEYYANTLASLLESEAKGLNRQSEVKLQQIIEIKHVSETSKYVSYLLTSYAFLGGAHGLTIIQGTTFNKANGQLLRQVIDTTKVNAMQPLLKRAIAQRLSDSDHTITENSIDSILFLDGHFIPLPVMQPYLTPKGVVFVYQEYEIGPYALGRITFTLPSVEIQPYLTAQAQALL